MHSGIFYLQDHSNTQLPITLDPTSHNNNRQLPTRI